MIQPYSFTYSSLNVAQQSTFARRDQGGQEEERTRNREQAPTRDNNQAALFKKVEALEKSLSLQSTREQNTSNNPLLEPDTPSSREYRASQRFVAVQQYQSYPNIIDTYA